jgi:hypothetical protein
MLSGSPVPPPVQPDIHRRYSGGRTVKKAVSLLVLAGAVVILAACHAHMDMQYTPQQYAKLRGIELLTSEPTRSYELVVNVEGSGGKFTAKETMINAMIDSAQKAGARALIPLESATSRGSKGLDVFVFTENGRIVTRGRAIVWTSVGP